MFLDQLQLLCTVGLEFAIDALLVLPTLVEDAIAHVLPGCRPSQGAAVRVMNHRTLPAAAAAQPQRPGVSSAAAGSGQLLDEQAASALDGSSAAAAAASALQESEIVSAQSSRTAAAAKPQASDRAASPDNSEATDAAAMLPNNDKALMRRTPSAAMALTVASALPLFPTLKNADVSAPLGSGMAAAAAVQSQRSGEPPATPAQVGRQDGLAHQGIDSQDFGSTSPPHPPSPDERHPERPAVESSSDSSPEQPDKGVSNRSSRRGHVRSPFCFPAPVARAVLSPTTQQPFQAVLYHEDKAESQNWDGEYEDIAAALFAAGAQPGAPTVPLELQGLAGTVMEPLLVAAVVPSSLCKECMADDADDSYRRQFTDEDLHNLPDVLGSDDMGPFPPRQHAHEWIPTWELPANMFDTPAPDAASSSPKESSSSPDSRRQQQALAALASAELTELEAVTPTAPAKAEEYGSKDSSNAEDSDGKVEFETPKKVPYPKNWWAEEDYAQKMLPYGIEHRMLLDHWIECATWAQELHEELQQAKRTGLAVNWAGLPPDSPRRPEDVPVAHLPPLILLKW